MDAKQIQEILDLHAKWLRSIEGGKRANISGAGLIGADLIGADLRWADLSGVNLSGANLRRANLRRADLRGANLYGADLRWANLSRANLSRANLRRANLSGANLYGANLRGADLRGADLRGANLCGADGKTITLIGDRPVLQIGPIGSRSDVLVAFLTDAGTYVRTGCYFGLLAEFKRAVRVTHAKSNPAHYVEYHAAIALIETHAKLYAEGKWTEVEINDKVAEFINQGATS